MNLGFVKEYTFFIFGSTGLDLLHSVGIAHLSLRIVLVTGISRYTILKLKIFDYQLVDLLLIIFFHIYFTK